MTPTPSICFLCPWCDHLLHAAVPMGGRAADCPGCDRPLIVPDTSTAPDDTLEMAIDTLTLAQIRAALAD